MFKKIDDIALISQIVLFDNKKAFEKIVIKHQSQVRQFFVNLTNDKYLADDLAQETFIKLFLNIRQFNFKAKFSTWLYRIAYNIFLDYKKSNKNKSNKQLTDDIEKNYKNNEPNCYENIGVRNLLNLLEEKEQEVITLSYIDDFSHSEISKILNIPLGTVKTNIRNGKQKMLKYLKSNKYEK